MTALLKHLHITCVALSYTLFFLRGVWMLRASPLMQQRWVKIAPHTVDTLLLASAIALAWHLGISPLSHPWLMAKIIALLLYIGLGFIAMRFGRTRRTRLAAWLLGQGVFSYIVAVAITMEVVP
ncbi:MAG TPA: SirB2 family protein [Gallionellaceae bacterium]|nr:SirB2 family protein [Gallionellaceae bacterium]